ncbi:MAG: hypothetical protein KCHDKBKB_01559 [Elusimicrobia bacterium]|nr:hypothetical protein [Elusimicrobiota bacterium]
MKGLKNVRMVCASIAVILLIGSAMWIGRGQFSNAVSRRKTSPYISAISSVVPPKNPASVYELLNMPEDQVDIGIISLTLAKEIYPDTDVASYSARIDVLADQVRRLAKGTKNPDQRVRCLNTVLLLHEKFQGTRDLSVARKSEYYFLNNVLDTKRGNCFTMPVLYIAVAQRLGWPVYPVSVPDHSFVRYVDPNLKEQNIETTSNGGYVPDEGYAKDFMVSERGRKSGAYLQTLSYRKSLGDLVAVNGIWFGQRGQLSKAITYLEIATKLNPKLAGAWMNLANANRMMAKRSNGAEAEKYLAMAAECSKKLDELGFVHPKDVPQFNSARRQI